MIQNILTTKNISELIHCLKMYEPKLYKEPRPLQQKAYSLLDNLLEQNIPKAENDIALDHDELIQILENSKELTIVKFSRISDIMEALTFHKAPKNIIIKFKLHPNYDITELCMNSTIEAETIISLQNDNTMDINEVEITAILCS